MSQLFRHFGVGLAAASSETLRVTYPGSAWLGDELSPTNEGTWAGSIVGSWHEVSSTHYLYVTQNDGAGRFVGVDPGDYEARLVGLTGVEIQLPAGTLDPDDVGTQVETQWNAAGTSIVATDNGSGQVDFVGSIDAAAIVAAGPGTDWESRNTEATCTGAQEYAASGVGNANIDWQTWCEVDNAFAPSTTYRVVGIVYRGTNLRIGIARGGAAAGDPEGATVLYDSGVLAGGGSTWHVHYFEPSEVFELEPTDRVWQGVEGTDGASDVQGGSSQNTGWVSTGGDNIFRTGASAGVGTPFPSTVPALDGGNFNFGLAMMMIVQPAPYFGSFHWQSVAVYDRVRQGNPGSTVGMESVAPTFPCSFPVVSGLAVESLQLFFASNAAGAQDAMRVESFESAGAMSLTAATGETVFHDFGEIGSGTDTGWLELVSTPVDISTVGELRFSIKSASVGAGMSLGFLSGGYGNDVGKVGWSLADTVEDGELEYTAAAGETWWDFRAGNATGSPLAPDSTPVTPGNQPGMYILIGIGGFQMEANP